MKKIVIIDYNIGNISAIANMLYRIGEKPIITNDHKDIDEHCTLRNSNHILVIHLLRTQLQASQPKY